MKALADASTLLLLVKHSEEGKLVGLASEIATLDLASYEAGNAIWKQVSLLRLINEAEAQAVHSAVVKLLSRVQIVRGDAIDYAKAMELAVRKQITYYDACYLAAAGLLGVALATEDSRLAKAAAGQDVVDWKDLARKD